MFKKKKDKSFEFNLKLIEEIGTLKIQNQILHEKIKNLEKRVADLELSRRVGF